MRLSLIIAFSSRIASVRSLSLRAASSRYSSWLWWRHFWCLRSSSCSRFRRYTNILNQYCTFQYRGSSHYLKSILSHDVATVFAVSCLEHAVDPWRARDFAGREGFESLSFNYREFRDGKFVSASILVVRSRGTPYCKQRYPDNDSHGSPRWDVCFRDSR